MWTILLNRIFWINGVYPKKNIWNRRAWISFVYFLWISYQSSPLRHFSSSNHINLFYLKKNLHTPFYILRQRFLQRKQLIISQRISDCQSLLKSVLFLFAFFIFSYYFLVCWLSFIIHASMKVLLWITNWSLKQF